MATMSIEESQTALEQAQADFHAEKFVQAEAGFVYVANQLRSIVLKGKDPDPVAVHTWVTAHCGAASSARALGGYARAEKRLNEAEAFVLKKLGPKDAIYPNILNERGMLRKYQGRFKESEAQYRICKPLVAKHFGKRSQSMAVLLHNMGGIAHAQGQWAKAEEFAREGLHIRELGDPDPLAVAADQSALAAILDGAGNHEEASELLATALATFKKKLGARSFEVGVTMETMGNLHYRTGDLKKADKLLVAALEIQEERLGTGHPELGFALNNLAVVRIDRGLPEDARPLLETALATFKKSFGPKHANTLAVLDRLKSLAGQAPKKAKKAAKKAKKAAKKATKATR